MAKKIKSMDEDLFLTSSRFTVGQVVSHKFLGYRGVIVDVDGTYQGSEDWYEEVARSKPPRDKPWYYVLVHDSERELYVAEHHLNSEATGEGVNHPLVPYFFEGFTNGVYVTRRKDN